jgi:hypothetical protein
MNKNLTEIVLVVDRSGSMSLCKTDAQGGINAFIEKQKNEPGDANLTLVQFDNEYEFVENGTPIKDVKPYVLEPRSMTALLDAVGRAISETGSRLAAMDEPSRPGLVIVVIVTDGKENASKEYKNDQIKEMIKEQQEKYNWQFIFLGATADTFDVATAIGIAVGGTALYSTRHVQQSYFATSDNVSRMRACASTGDTVNASFTVEERQSMVQ